MFYFRTRADNAHLALENVYELRQFIEFIFAKKSTDRRDAGIVIRRGSAADSLRIDHHGPELVNPKWRPPQAGALSTIENGTAVPPDNPGDSGDHWTQKQ